MRAVPGLARTPKSCTLATESRRLPSRTAFAMGALAERNLQEVAGIRASLSGSKGYRKLVKGKTRKGFEKDIERKQPSAVKAGKKKVK
jgi:hypothetical protein